jgi:hypothetical protein
VRTRGFVRTADVAPVPGAPGQFSVDVRLVDASNVEQYCRWKGPHFIGSEPASALGIEHGDDVEIVLLSDGRGGYTKASYVHNHTRGVRYTFVKAKTGCLSVMAALAAVAGALLAAAFWAAL